VLERLYAWRRQSLKSDGDRVARPVEIDQAHWGPRRWCKAARHAEIHLVVARIAGDAKIEHLRESAADGYFGGSYNRAGRADNRRV
jgi:hypothetical protein